jgi:hypothetical protein
VTEVGGSTVAFWAIARPDEPADGFDEAATAVVDSVRFP